MKKLILSTVIALMLIVTFAVPAFAYDYEDQIVAANDDFVYGFGVDVSTGTESHSGGQSWNADGYNLYQDDVTDTGNLDAVLLVSYTPEDIDLPHITPSWWFIPGSASGVSLDTWYWATEPRGKDGMQSAENPYVGQEGQLTVVVFGYSYHDTFKWEGHWWELPQILGEDAVVTGVQNGTTCTISIPAGTQLSYPDRPGVLINFLEVDIIDGEVVISHGNMDFSQPVTLTVNGETITFTEIRDGKPVL